MSIYSLAAEDIAGIPCLRMSAADVSANAPTAIVLHGLTRSKESVLNALYALAQRGITAIAPDARLHGDRPGADMRDDRLQSDYLSAMAEIINGTVQDISLLLDTLNLEQASVHGVSLGGYVAFSAMVAEPRLVAAAIALGSPDLAGPMRDFGLGPGHPFYDAVVAQSPLERAPAAYPPRPLLMLHGDQDTTVPVNGVQALHQRLAPHYAAQPDRLELVVYPGLDHVYTDDMLSRSVEWIVRWHRPLDGDDSA